MITYQVYVDLVEKIAGMEIPDQDEAVIQLADLITTAKAVMLLAESGAFNEE